MVCWSCIGVMKPCIVVGFFSLDIATNYKCVVECYNIPVL